MTGAPDVVLRARRTALLPGWVWVYLLATFVPVAVWVTTLKIIRVLSVRPWPGVVDFLDQIRSELGWCLGLLLLFAVLVAITRAIVARVVARRRPEAERSVRRHRAVRLTSVVVLAVGQLLAMVTAVFDRMNHEFLRATGSNLGLGRIKQYFEDSDEIGAVLRNQMNPLVPVLLVLVGLLVLIVPPVLARLSLRLDRPRRRRPAVASRIGRVALAALLAAGLIASAGIPAASSPAYLSRDGLVSLGLGELTDLRYASEENAPVTIPDAPTKTYLTPTDGAKKKNVVMVFMESIRWSATTMGNPDLDTTPYLDQLSRQGLLATHAHAMIPHTSKALTTAHCGIEPPMDTTNSEADAAGLPSRCLPELLGDLGYSSVFFQSATEKFERRRDLVRNLGYDEFVPEDEMSHAGFGEVNYFGYEDDIMLQPSHDWLTAHDRQPFLATYLTVTTHHDYTLPASWPRTHYSDDPHENDYLNGVRYTDRFVQQLMAQYKKLGLLDDTIFVIMADHGEGFGEHGLKQHDNTIYDEGTHVPLMIIDPSLAPQKLTTPVQETSLLPTIAQLLGYSIGGGTYQAKSMLSKDLPGRIKISCFLENECLALIDGKGKYIYHFGNRPDEYFDLDADPGETHNIIRSQPKAKIAALRRELLSWRTENEGLYAQRTPPTTTHTPGTR